MRDVGTAFPFSDLTDRVAVLHSHGGVALPSLGAILQFGHMVILNKIFCVTGRARGISSDRSSSILSLTMADGRGT
jgi:hypothetical protein